MDLGDFENTPRNIRRTKIVRHARSLDSAGQARIIQELCRSRNNEAASTEETGKDNEVLQKLLGEGIEGNPTLSYHYQEVGLLVAASVAEKEPLLRLARGKSNEVIYKKATLLSIHSDCVTDNDIRDLFNSANEREKKKIVRSCAREYIREDLTNEFIYSWLKETDSRRVLACEILHSVKVGTEWLPASLRDIIQKGLEASFQRSIGKWESSRKSSIDELCFKQIRRDLLWKRHGDIIINQIERDLKVAKGILERAEVFEFWNSFLVVDWKIPGVVLNSQKSATMALSVPWKKLIELYAEYIPYEPSVQKIKNLYQQKKFGSSSWKSEGSKTDAETLENMLTLISWNEDWGSHLSLLVPTWLFSAHVKRVVKPEDFFRIVRTKFMNEDGTFPKRFAGIIQELFNAMCATIDKSWSSELFNEILKLVKSITKLISPSVFFNQQKAEECYETPAEHQRIGEICQSQTTVLNNVKIILGHQRITSGQQLEIFKELQVYSKTLILKSADFSSPLNLTTPSHIKGFVKKYEDFLKGFVETILSSFQKKIIKNPENKQMSVIFNRICNLGLLEVQSDVEAMYRDLSKPFPIAFGFPPTSNVSVVLVPKIFGYSSGRKFQTHSDEAARMVDEIFVSKVLPAARKENFGEDALWNDRPGRSYSKLKYHSNDVKIRGQAVESLEVYRLECLRNIQKIGTGFQNESLSSRSTSALLDFLSEWISVANEFVQKCADSKKENRYATHLNPHPEDCPNTKVSLREIGTFLETFIERRLTSYFSNEWKGQAQTEELQFIKRAFTLWSSANFDLDKNDPLKSGNSRLDPYILDKFLKLGYRLPAPLIVEYSKLFNSIFALRLRGEIQLGQNNVISAPESSYNRGMKDRQAWTDASELFTTIFSSERTRFASYELLSFLEKADKVSQNFLKSLERFMDIKTQRKRLELDLSRPMFTDRLECMRTLLAASTRSKSCSEISRTFAKLCNAIENEVHDSRIQVIELILAEFSGSVIQLVMPSATGGGTASDRFFVQFLQSLPSNIEEITEAAEKFPSIILKLLDDLLESTDEKKDANFKVFRTVSDDIFRQCLTWACSTVKEVDPRIVSIQNIWFDCAMEIQWKITCFKSGRSLSMNTFRPMLTGPTFSKIKTFILESGYQPEIEFPNGKEETRKYNLEAEARRALKAQMIVGLFEQGYSTRIANYPVPLGSPLTRKPAMEKKRLLDLINLVQGEVINCQSVSNRFADIIDQCALSETSRSHQAQVFDLCKELTETSVSWKVKCRDSRPPWAPSFKTSSLYSTQILRGKRRGGGGGGSGGRKKTFSKKGRGGRTTTPVDLDEEDAPWCVSEYFQYLPSSIIPKYWKICVEQFGIQHPYGQTKGRMLLRMHLRWNFYLADSKSTRSERQTIRCATALQLLDICPSAIHLRVVQAVLKDFRQDLLSKYVFSHEISDPILGKFSKVSPDENDDDQYSDGIDDGDEDDNNTNLIRPFRLPGFFGFYKFTYEQGRKLAKILIEDVLDPNLATVERLRAVNKLSFLPCVDHSDFAGILRKHFQDKEIYSNALKMKKKDPTSWNKESPPTLPLPEGVVETCFHSVLGDANPLALVSLLDTNMIQKSSTKTTVLVAQRAAVLLEPMKVTEIIRVLFKRRGRDALLVGPVKAFLRILFNFANESEHIIGRDVIVNAIQILSATWGKKDLHPDARAVLVANALKTISNDNKEYVDFAWEIVQQVASSSDYNNLFRLMLIAAEPYSSHFQKFPISTNTTVFSQEFRDLVKEAERNGTVIIPKSSIARYLSLLIEARETCLALALVATANRDDPDRRKRNSARKLANLSKDVASLLIIDLYRWIEMDSNSYQKVFTVLSQATLLVEDYKKTSDNSSRCYVYDSLVPTQLAKLANESYSGKFVAKDENIVTKMIDILSPLVKGLVSQVPLSESNKRAYIVERVRNLSQNLSKEGGVKRLYRVAFSEPFKLELGLLKKETEISSLIASFCPDQKVLDDEVFDEN